MRRLLLVTLPALVCAAVGLLHPAGLGPDTAQAWLVLHIVLLPVFPLVGLAPWLLTRGAPRVFRWAAAVLGYGFATCYTALDVLAGIGGGAMVLGGRSEATGPLFRIADALASVGVISLVLGLLVAGVAALATSGIRSLPGTLIAVIGAVLIDQGHVWFPLGTLAFVLLAAGCGIVALIPPRRPR